MKYQPPFGPNWPNVADPNAPYVNGNPPAGLAGSIPPASSIEYPMREIVNLITSGGYLPSDTDLHQLTRGVRRAYFAFATDTGSQNNLSIAVDPPLTAYEQATELRVMVAYDNTGPCVIRVNGVNPAQQIVHKDGSPLIQGDLRQGGIAVLVYDGANFQLVSGAAGSVTIASGWFNGADYIVDVGTVNHIVGTPPIAPTAYAAGQGFTILVKNRNSGPVDINVNALGPVPMKAPGNTDLVAGDIMPNMLIRVWFDGTAFKMLSPIWMERIDTAVSWIVGPNAGADFADLNAAMLWLTRRRIDIQGTVTLNLQGATAGAALVHNYSASVFLEHPDGSRLSIVGGAMTPPSSNGLTSTGADAGHINADSNANIAALRNVFRTELRFSGHNGILVRGIIGLFSNILVTGGTTMGTGGANQNLIGVAAGHLNINCVCAGICSGCAWYIDINASVSGSHFYAIGSQFFSVGLAHSANLVITDSNFAIAGAYVDGIQAAHGAIMQMSQSNRPKLYSIGQTGINHWGASSVHCASISGLHIGWYGISTVAANSWVQSSQFSYIGISAYYASQNANMDCDTCYGAAVNGAVYSCNNGAFMYAAAPQGQATFTPTPNTFGNSAGYISA